MTEQTLVGGVCDGVGAVGAAPRPVIGRVFCEPQGRATDEWLLRYLQRAVAELQLTVDALTERVERIETLAAVTEGGASLRRSDGCKKTHFASERPEPSPHLQDPRDALVDGHETPFTRQHVYWAIQVDGWPTFLAVNALAAQKLERERDAARTGTVHVDFARKLERERDEAREALRALFDDYKQLADSGDAGFWELEDKPAAQPALRILQQMEAAK